jgi:hypothetical protein
MKNPKLKRFTSASLIAVLLLVGFVAEYAHRHAMPSAGPAEFAQGDDPSSGQINLQQNADFCFVCQAQSVAIACALVGGLFFFYAEQRVVILENFVPASSSTSHTFLRRGPPAFLA